MLQLEVTGGCVSASFKVPVWLQHQFKFKQKQGHLPPNLNHAYFYNCQNVSQL